MIEGFVDTIQRMRTNDRGAWAVFDLVVGRDVVTCRGVGPIAPGRSLRAEGRLSSGRYGDIFEASDIMVIEPKDDLAASVFLGRALVLAQGFSDRDEISAIVGDVAEAVRAVRGEGLSAYVRDLQESPAEINSLFKALGDDFGGEHAPLVARYLKGERDIALSGQLLAAAGMSVPAVQRVLARFGHDVGDIVRDDLYKLAVVAGVDFETVDRVGEAFGSSTVAPGRLVAAALLSARRIREDQGHCWTPPAEIEAMAGRKLRDEDQGMFALGTALEKNQLIEDRGRIYEPAVLAAEKSSASVIGALMAEGPRVGDDEIVRRLRVIKPSMFSRYNLEQRRAIVMALSEPVSQLRGRPGAGKSTIGAPIIQAALAGGEKVVALSHMATAAQRFSRVTGYEAMTVCRFLGMTEGGASHYGPRNLLKDGTFILVDEHQTMDLNLNRALLRAMSLGCRILMLGDDAQLGSIGAGRCFRDIAQSGVVPSLDLVETYRAHGRELIQEGAEAIRAGQLPPLPDSLQGGVIFFDRDGPGVLAEVPQLVADILPSRGYDIRSEVRIVTPVHGGPSGTVELNRAVQNLVNPDGTMLGGEPSARHFFRVEPRLGDPVLQLESDEGRGVFNGMSGILVAVERGSAKVRFAGVEKAVLYDPDQFGQLTTAYAMTPDRMQGDQVRVVVPVMTAEVGGRAQRDVLLTAWTRGMELVVMVGERDVIAASVETFDANSRRTGLADRLKAAAPAVDRQSTWARYDELWRGAFREVSLARSVASTELSLRRA